MKRFLTISASSALFLAFALPAAADVTVTADIYKEKDIVINEDVYKDKNVEINATVDVELDKASEAGAIVNVVTSDNSVTTGHSDITGSTVKKSTIENSIGYDDATKNTGIMGVNQASGNMNSQGNVVSGSVDVDAVDAAGNPLLGFSDAQSSVEQDNTSNSVNETHVYNSYPAGFEYHRYSLITNSIKNNLGVTGVNQSSGDMNNQTNSTSLAVNSGLSAMVALAEADLGQYNANNRVHVVNTETGTYITNSINSNHGITNVNQTTGNMNNQGISIAASGMHP